MQTEEETRKYYSSRLKIEVPSRVMAYYIDWDELRDIRTGQVVVDREGYMWFADWFEICTRAVERSLRRNGMDPAKAATNVAVVVARELAGWDNNE